MLFSYAERAQFTLDPYGLLTKLLLRCFKHIEDAYAMGAEHSLNHQRMLQQFRENKAKLVNLMEEVGAVERVHLSDWMLVSYLVGLLRLCREWRVRAGDDVARQCLENIKQEIAQSCSEDGFYAGFVGLVEYSEEINYSLIMHFLLKYPPMGNFIDKILLMIADIHHYHYPFIFGLIVDEIATKKELSAEEILPKLFLLSEIISTLDERGMLIDDLVRLFYHYHDEYNDEDEDIDGFLDALPMLPEKYWHKLIEIIEGEIKLESGDPVFYIPTDKPALDAMLDQLRRVSDQAGIDQCYPQLNNYEKLVLISLLEQAVLAEWYCDSSVRIGVYDRPTLATVEEILRLLAKAGRLSIEILSFIKQHIHFASWFLRILQVFEEAQALHHVDVELFKMAKFLNDFALSHPAEIKGIDYTPPLLLAAYLYLLRQVLRLPTESMSLVQARLHSKENTHWALSLIVWSDVFYPNSWQWLERFLKRDLPVVCNKYTKRFLFFLRRNDFSQEEVYSYFLISAELTSHSSMQRFLEEDNFVDKIPKKVIEHLFIFLATGNTPAAQKLVTVIDLLEVYECENALNDLIEFMDKINLSVMTLLLSQYEEVEEAMVIAAARTACVSQVDRLYIFLRRVGFSNEEMVRWISKADRLLNAPAIQYLLSSQSADFVVTKESATRFFEYMTRPEHMANQFITNTVLPRLDIAGSVESWEIAESIYRQSPHFEAVLSAASKTFEPSSCEKNTAFVNYVLQLLITHQTFLVEERHKYLVEGLRVIREVALLNHVNVLETEAGRHFVRRLIEALFKYYNDQYSMKKNIAIYFNLVKKSVVEAGNILTRLSPDTLSDRTRYLVSIIKGSTRKNLFNDFSEPMVEDQPVQSDRSAVSRSFPVAAETASPPASSARKRSHRSLWSEPSIEGSVATTTSEQPSSPNRSYCTSPATSPCASPVKRFKQE